MITNSIDMLEKALNKIRGADVMVCISHRLYGDQKIKCNNFDYILDDEHIGVCIGGHRIYMNKRDLRYCGTKNNIYFADDVMEIRIK